MDGPALIRILVSFIIGSLVLAVFLRAATKWVLKRDTAFGHAFVTALATQLIHAIIYLVTSVASGRDLTNEGVSTLSVVTMCVDFLLNSAVVASRLKVSFAKGILVFLTVAALLIAVALVISIVGFAIVKLMG